MSMIYHYRVTIIVHLMHLGKWYSALALSTGLPKEKHGVSPV